MADKFHADIYITLKESVLDPQGQVVLHALENLGFQGISTVRVGKWIQMEIAADNEESAKKTAEMSCDKLLVNKVIETYHLNLKKA